MGWTTSADVTDRLRRHWEAGRILAAGLDGPALFPMQLPVARPDARALSERFDAARQWIRELEDNSKARLGYGYEIGWTDVNHRSLGRNRIPTALVVPTEDDALHLIGKTREARRFRQLVETTLATLPSLRRWIGTHPLALVERADEWPQVLAVLSWFRDHPRPGLYLRQLDIPDVDTKFIESRRKLLSELLDQVLPASAIEAGFSGARDFERRYGLRCKPDLVRFRILDNARHVHGWSDISVPAHELKELKIDVERAFITENEVTGLAFPEVADSVVIFGLGYGLERLSELQWLGDKAIYYWGDIDTHGFTILDRFRSLWPHVQSLLMDRETLLGCRHLWVTEEDRSAGPLSRLTPVEQELFDDLLRDRMGVKVRLEQERISFRRLMNVLATLSS